MSVDMRGFVYALEPLRRKQQWQLEAAQRRLGQAQAAHDAAQAALTELQAVLAGVAQGAGRAADGRVDPAQHQRTLAYLIDMRGRIDAQQAVLEQTAAARDAARADCLVAQQRCEALARHREQHQDEYRAEELARQASETDRDWLARSAWRSGLQHPIDSEEAL
jgi:flagellar export protein FliJ